MRSEHSSGRKHVYTIVTIKYIVTESREEFVDRGICFLLLLQDLETTSDVEQCERWEKRKKSHLRNSKLKIFLCNVLPSLSQGIHT